MENELKSWDWISATVGRGACLPLALEITLLHLNLPCYFSDSCRVGAAKGEIHEGARFRACWCGKSNLSDNKSTYSTRKAAACVVLPDLPSLLKHLRSWPLLRILCLSGFLLPRSPWSLHWRSVPGLCQSYSMAALKTHSRSSIHQTCQVTFFVFSCKYGAVLA